MKKVVFGGSFNPPTIAHEKIIEILSNLFDEVIVVPNGTDYIYKNNLNNDDRFKMLEIIANEYSNVTISDIELKRPFTGTVNTLRDLGHPVFACGDDCLKELHNWIDAPSLLAENEFLIFTRHETIPKLKKFLNEDSFLAPYQNKFNFQKLDFPMISSSEYRQTADRTLLSTKIEQYIHSHKLYEVKNMFYNNYLKVALATPKVSLGNPMENANEILNIASNYEKASIIVFPELSITGYSIGDWIFNQELLSAAKDALNYLREKSGQQILIVGLPLEYAGSIYNVAAVIQNKHILGIIPKVNLPYSREFYEMRFFTSGEKIINQNIKINLFGEEVLFGSLLFKNQAFNVCFGIEICGDLWANVNPHTKLYQNGADIVFNISASTFYLNKKRERRMLVEAASNRFEGAYLYVSCGPSDTTSDVTFTGHQIASICGDTIIDDETLNLESVVNCLDIDLEYIRFSRYTNSYCHKSASDVICANFDLALTENYILEKKPNLEPFVPKNNDEFNDIINIVTTSLKHRLDYIGIDKVVIGISGGLDSTLALLFAYDTYKKYGMNTKNIHAITMPGLGTGSKSKNLALNLMSKLNVTSNEVSIKKEALIQLKLLQHDPAIHDITYENVQARARTNYLMNYANLIGGMVIGTGDMSEIALGWSTFNGDHMAMYNLNAGLPKTAVKALVKYHIDIYPEIKVELKKVYNAIISPELTGSDQATEDKIGKYQINDFVMYHLFTKGASKERIIYLLEICFGLKKNQALKYYTNFLKRFNSNQYKRLTGPEGVKIFELSFSPRGDFRYPGDMK